ncbi:DinB family protein [Paenibacillus lutrae]|uniref:DUF664 domain-containing protein n=1 Tax=Paenibacillus lutrae TaxID=2078573 RepID=A0A7X3FMN0_9BACL|nr:DinB family protein [Paenibacillus lutrae]MVP02442.1 DUF664 domain-containing protein [Paenibacillus lutrae]
MSETVVDIGRYLATYAQLKEAIEGLSEEQLTWKPAPDKWSITEVLAHLADHNLIVTFRIREILAGSDKPLPSFNQDEWVGGQKANEGDASEYLDLFDALLRYNSFLFYRLSKEDWEKTSDFRGNPVTVGWFVEAFTNHVGKHLGQIERNKSAYVPV